MEDHSNNKSTQTTLTQALEEMFTRNGFKIIPMNDKVGQISITMCKKRSNSSTSHDSENKK